MEIIVYTAAFYQRQDREVPLGHRSRKVWWFLDIERIQNPCSTVSYVHKRAHYVPVGYARSQSMLQTNGMSVGDVLCLHQEQDLESEHGTAPSSTEYR